MVYLLIYIGNDTIFYNSEFRRLRILESRFPIIICDLQKRGKYERFCGYGYL